MELKEIITIGVMALGLPIAGYAANELRKKYVKFAEENKFYDESPKFSDLEKEMNYVGKKVKFNGTANPKIEANKFYDDAINISNLKDKVTNTGKTVKF